MSSIVLNWQPGLTLEMIEELAIKQAFTFFRGNKSATSRALDISVRTLEAKLEKYENDEHRNKDAILAANRRDENFLRRQRGLPELSDRDFEGRSFDEQLSRNAEREHREFVNRQLTGNSAAAAAAAVQANNQHGQNAGAGVRIQPASDTESKHAMPVSQRKEIQEMSPKSASGSGANKRR